MRRVSCALAIAALLVTGAVSAGPAAAGLPPTPPTISSFSPTSGPAYSSVLLTGKGLDTIDWWALNGDSPGFWWDIDAQHIRVQVPYGAGDGKFSVGNSAGSTSSKGRFHILPGIDAFDPVEAFPGDDVEIVGTDLEGATKVRFGSKPAQFTVVDDQTIDATIPASAVSGPVTVTTPKGTGTSGPGLSMVVIRKPTITSFTPVAGVPGTNVKIYGTNLDSVHQVTLGGVDLSSFINHFRVDRSPLPGRLGVTIPSGALKGRLEVTNAAGSATSAKSYDVVLEITGVTPDNGLPGDAVEIDGRGFTGASKVTFGGKAASFHVDDDSTIETTVPAGGGSDVGVTVRGVTGYGSFTRVIAPTVTSFTPSAPVGGRVDVEGSMLIYGTGDVNGVGVGEIGGNDRGTRAHFSVPDGASTGPLTLTNRAGSTTTPLPLVVSPAVTGFTPTHGVPGSTVEIHGTSFTGAVRVQLATGPAEFTVVDDSTIRATVPGTVGRGKVVVTTCTGDGGAYESSGTSSGRFGVLGGSPSRAAPHSDAARELCSRAPGFLSAF